MAVIFGSAPAQAFLAGDTRGGVARVVVYGDSLWLWNNGCDACPPLEVAGWTVWNAAVNATPVWPNTLCVAPYPNSGLCVNGEDIIVEKPGSLCGRLDDVTGDAVPEPVCARQLAGPLDVLVIQYGTNDVRLGWVQSNRLEGFVKPAWEAILDETEALGLPVVVVHPIPIYADHVEGIPGPAGDDYLTEHAQLREIRDWLHNEELPTRSHVVEVDAFEAFLHHERAFGEAGLLGLYFDCPVKGTQDVADDCVHLSVTPNAAGKSGGDVLGEAVRNGVRRATALRAGPLVEPDPPAGSYPANNPAVWGANHPECPAVSGSCPGTASAGQTIENCNMTSSINVTGSNVTIQCVNWSIASSFGMLELGADIRDLRIDRVTVDGGGATEVSDLLKISSTKGTGHHTVQLTRSVLGNARVPLLLGGGKLDKDVADLTDFPGYAFAATENIFTPPAWDPDPVRTPPDGPHSEHLALVETTDGALVRHNVFDCDSAHNGGNPCNTSHILGQPSGGGVIQNIVIEGNRFIGDTSATNGYDFTFDEDKSSPGNCVTPLDFKDNVIEQVTTDTWNNTGCPSIGSRGDCSGNTLNGSPLVSSGCTP